MLEEQVRKVSRAGGYPDKAVFVDGLFGCGKTMLSPIIGSLDRVELLSYLFEVENLCALYSLGEVSLEGAASVVKMSADVKLYNTMMGRDVNFRPTDLSSAIRDINPSRYFQRLFLPGDEALPQVIEETKPILHIVTHNLLPFAEPIFHGMKDSAVFVEVVRHPLYMFKQILLNMENLIGDPRDFTVNFRFKDKLFPYYMVGVEEEFLSANSAEKVILYIRELSRKSEVAREKYKTNTCTIPFESFVLNPKPYMEELTSVIGTKYSSKTEEMLLKQKVPRTKTVSGLDLDIYKRCGWTPSNDDLTEKQELDYRYDFAIQNLNAYWKNELDQLIANYETKFWKPE